MKKRITEFFSNNFLTIIAGVAIALSIGIFIFYYRQGLTLAYGDGKARLNIARRVIDSLTPGLAQLGSVWPPFPHLLYLTTVWNNFMYYSGLSGSIVSMASYVITIVFLSKLLFETIKDKMATIIGILLILLNPSFLYIQTTPMTESLFIGLLTLSAFLLWRWYKSPNILYLICTATVVFCASLTRYDGWFLAVTIAAVVGVVAFLRGGYKMMEGNILLYATPAFSGMVGWILYQLIILGNPLYFAIGEGSASYAAAGDVVSGFVTTKYHLLSSFLAYSWATIDNVGVIAVAIIFLGLIYLLLSGRKASIIIPAIILGSPIIFNIVSLFLGQSELFTQHLYPFNLYNLRYGLLGLPLIAYLTGWLASKRMAFKIILLILVLLQTGILLQSKPITLIEPLANPFLGPESKELSLWLNNRQVKGLTLLSVRAHDPLIFDARIKYGRLIYEGSGKFWEESLKDPSSIAERVIISPNNSWDAVWKASQENKEFFDGLSLVFKNHNYEVFDKIGTNNTIPLVEKTIVSLEVMNDKSETVEKLPAETSCDYTVKVGDSLWRIAKNKLGEGSYFIKIIELNKDNENNFDLPTIHPDQKIVIPCT